MVAMGVTCANGVERRREGWERFCLQRMTCNLYASFTVSTFLDLGSGIDCPKTLFRGRHFQVSDADLNPSSSSSHIRILSSNCIHLTPQWSL